MNNKEAKEAGICAHFCTGDGACHFDKQGVVPNCAKIDPLVPGRFICNLGNPSSDPEDLALKQASECDCYFGPWKKNGGEMVVKVKTFSAV